MARCETCGREMDPGEARCPECQAPVAGDPRQAPEGSDPPAPEAEKHAGAWNAMLWVGMGVAVLVGVLVALL